MVIGNDLYEIVKHLDNYSFKPIAEQSVGLKFDYPVYSMIQKGGIDH